MEVKLLDVDYKKIESYLNGDSKLGHKIFGSIKKDDGYVFRLYAPKADRVLIKGDFSNWQEIPMFKNEKYGKEVFKCFDFRIEIVAFLTFLSGVFLIYESLQ